MPRDNIVLIGMPASGKSTAGVILAKLLGYEFIDTDLLLQRRAGCRLSELMERDGLDGFLEMESEVCAELDVRRTVVATGGSVVYGARAMARLKELGRVVYLQVPFGALAARLCDIRGRGVVLRKGQTLEELYAERVRLYERYADLIVPEDGLTLEQTVAAIQRALEEP